jgi:hypothetical protein
VVPDLKVLQAVHLLPGQAAVAYELSVMRLDNPQAVPVLRVVLLVPLNPACCFLLRLGRRVEAHHLWISEQRAHVVEVSISHLSELQSISRLWR